MNKFIIMKDPAVIEGITFIRKKYGQQQLVKSWLFVLYRPRFLLLSVLTFATLQLARAFACDGINSDNGPLRLGRSSFGLK